MSPALIQREILIQAPIDVVWGVVTEPAHIATWFCDAVELELRPGAEGAIVWNAHGRAELRVESVEPPYLFSYRWSAPDSDSENMTRVEFRLSEEAGGTRLVVTESGHLDTDWSDDRKERYATDHDTGWGGFLEKLAACAAEHSGTPAAR